MKIPLPYKRKWSSFPWQRDAKGWRGSRHINFTYGPFTVRWECLDGSGLAKGSLHIDCERVVDWLRALWNARKECE